MDTLEETFQTSNRDEQIEQAARRNAAVRIQRVWRKHTRRQYLSPEFLWSDAITHARMRVGRDAAGDGKNAPRERWKRGAFLASRLKDGNDMLARSAAQNSHSDAARKHLETQHWLELIDGRVFLVHANIVTGPIFYHARWKQDDTSENFFKWLDHGGGKALDLKECPRQQLESERITYLSSEQRLNYLVTIDNTGKLRWARNGQLVDTTAGRWKDAGDGRGIVPLEQRTASPTIQPRHSFTAPATSFASSSSTSVSGDEVSAMMHYVGIRQQTKNPIKRLLLRNFTLRGLLEKLLRKTVRRNTWIYVSDHRFNIFIGIKKPGSFQHSSFLAGGLVTSAGLISVKNGMVHTLSPLSGHYRTSIEHFRRFISVLEERGVDMSTVEISKAEIALWGIEHIGKFKKKQAKALQNAKQGTLDTAKRVAGVVPSLYGKSGDTSWKREILEGKQRRASAKAEGPDES